MYERTNDFFDEFPAYWKPQDCNILMKEQFIDFFCFMNKYVNKTDFFVNSWTVADYYLTSWSNPGVFTTRWVYVYNLRALKLNPVFIFVDRRSKQLYLNVWYKFEPIYYKTNGMVMKKINITKKSLKKTEKLSLFNVKVLIQKINTGFTKYYDLLIIFLKLKKLYSKVLKVLNKDLKQKDFDLSFFFFIKKSYSIIRLKKKRSIKKRLTKRLINLKKF